MSLGWTRSVPVDIRLVVATHARLEERPPAAGTPPNVPSSPNLGRAISGTTGLQRARARARVDQALALGGDAPVDVEHLPAEVAAALDEPSPTERRLEEPKRRPATCAHIARGFGRRRVTLAFDDGTYQLLFFCIRAIAIGLVVSGGFREEMS